jgi:redox-sensitive bicupin YhaK (pirin superfamily)
MSLRPVRRLIEAKPTLEGAGVRLRRAFGFGNTSEFDPFLLLDDFRNDVPDDYLADFPWHPHRGIETITYVLAGTVEHADNRSLVLFDSGENAAVQAGDEGIRFLLVSGKPLQEPVAWYGPIVMNTQVQLQQAFEELREGTFLKPASS